MTEREEKWPDMFSMNGLQIIKNSTSKDNGDGTSSFSLSFPVCEVSDYLEQPEVILEIMNVGAHPYAKAAPALYEALNGLIKDMEQRARNGMTGGHVDSDGVPVLAAGATVVINAYAALSQARGETGEEG